MAALRALIPTASAAAVTVQPCCVIRVQSSSRPRTVGGGLARDAGLAGWEAVLRPDIDQYNQEHLVERGALREADFGFGSFRYPVPPWCFADTRPLNFFAAPRLGEHNREILGGLPLDTAEDPVQVRKH